jgi:hypothetical protein
MSRPRCRELLTDDDRALAIAVQAGAHGVYVQNALALGEGEGFVYGTEQDQGLGWFGPRGNLVVVAVTEPTPAIAAFVVDRILAAALPWRLAMGPTAVIDALAQRLPVAPLVCRDQIYYRGAAATASTPHPEVRSAQRADRDRLMQATLLLNQADLQIDPARVDRRWLRDTIDERTAAGGTHVIGPVGGPWCKLDVGSDGPGGQVIEGVFTFPEHRGKGLAAGLVAACLRRAPAGAILHVGQHNRPARAAYEHAGMATAGRCRLLLLG